MTHKNESSMENDRKMTLKSVKVGLGPNLVTLVFWCHQCDVILLRHN